jgi:orotate phosphoribosyltransferase
MNEHLEWCRSFIDHACILRSPPGQRLLVGRDERCNVWQFYLPVATLDQRFQAAIAGLFWERFDTEFKLRPFQLCGCESGGVPLICALQAAAYAQGFTCNIFAIKKQHKSYGIKNWIEGMVNPDLPVLLVDDVVGGKGTLTAQAQRLREFGLDVIGAFCIASCKQQRPLSFKLGDRSIEITVLYGPDSFARTHETYLAKYGKPPQFEGALR